MISAALVVLAMLQVSDVIPDTLPPASVQLAAAVDTIAHVAPSPAPLGPLVQHTALSLENVEPDTGAVRRRKAIEYSSFYETRATIHRVASYAIVPLFAAQYVLGQKLMDNRYSSSTRNLHGLVAGGVAGLFGLNTLTGAWNLWDSRHDPAGRTRRYVHTALMLIADAGFMATGATAEGDNRNTHRALALGSMGISVGSAAMMWFWKD